MADSSNIIPFILQAEGGYVNNSADLGGETNKGITYATWQQYFGPTHNRFIAMSDADWQYIFVHGFWDTIMGDQIQSQSIADFMADFFWGSGYYAIRHLQMVLVDLGYQLTVDGQMGPKTLAAVNDADPQTLLDALKADRSAYYNAIVESNPSQAQFLQGWLNRLNNLYAQVSTYIGDAATAVVTTAQSNPGTTAVLFFCLHSAFMASIEYLAAGHKVFS
jgi:lysozyme family protein